MRKEHSEQKTKRKIIIYSIVIIILFVILALFISTFINSIVNLIENKHHSNNPRVVYHMGNNQTLEMFDNGTTMIIFK